MIVDYSLQEEGGEVSEVLEKVLRDEDVKEVPEKKVREELGKEGVNENLEKELEEVLGRELLGNVKQGGKGKVSYLIKFDKKR